MSVYARTVGMLLTTLLVTGCSTIGGWFTVDDDDDPQAPAELIAIDEQLNVRKLWSVGVGNGQGKGLYKLQPVIDDDVIYAASANGEVRAVSTKKGSTLWRQKLKRGLAGGVGVYDDALFLGSADGEVLRLSAETGDVLWESRVSGEILAPPQSNGRVVVTQTYDGKLYGLDFESGERLWRYDSNVPVLTIRGTSTPIVDGNTIYAGFASGRVLAFDATDGSVRWESRIAIPQGRSEIERIVDVDGRMAVAGTELYVASYQGRIVALDTRTGRKIWQRNTSSFFGVSQGFGNVYLAEENGTITAFLRNGQGIRWEQDALAWRGLAQPVPVSSYLAIVDFQGYMHFLSQVDGEFVARVRPDGDGVRADPIAEGNTLYVYSNSGKLIAYDVRPKG
ncbi:MAG: outer membrane protein assembly factor BamB [Pseudomonadota bacterium]